MNKEELIKFLKENLVVDINTDYNCVTVSLKLCGEIISESQDWIK